jgi:hypothetical protein
MNTEIKYNIGKKYYPQKQLRDAEGLTQIAREKAMRDANKQDIQTTSEGKSYLSWRYKYWFDKLSAKRK